MSFRRLAKSPKTSFIASSTPMCSVFCSPVSRQQSCSGQRAAASSTLAPPSVAFTPPDSAIYTATKGAVDAVTGVLASELGPKKIRVNSINPGMVETEGVHSAGFIGSDFEKGAVAQTPLGRIGQPGDIAPLAVFLASSDSGWLTGETILASGGLR